MDCPRGTVDKFTVSTANGNGKSRHKVGLITFDEVQLVGFSWGKTGNSYLDTGSSSAYWWLLSPAVGNDNGVTSNGVIFSFLFAMPTNTSYGVRPMISLKHSIGVSDGKGTASEPYVIN